MTDETEETPGDPDLDPVLAALVVTVLCVLVWLAGTILRTGPTTVLDPPAPRPNAEATAPR